MEELAISGMARHVNEHVEACHECAFGKKASRVHADSRVNLLGRYPFEIVVG